MKNYGVKFSTSIISLLMLFSFTMSERIPITPTIQAFLERMRKFDKDYPKEGEYLREELDLWAAAVYRPGKTPAEMIANQVEFSVGETRRRGV